MKVITCSAASKALGETMRMVCRDRTPLVITGGRSGSVVMVSLEEFTSLEETAHLLKSPANARRLARAKRDLDRGRGRVVDPAALR